MFLPYFSYINFIYLRKTNSTYLYLIKKKALTTCLSDCYNNKFLDIKPSDMLYFTLSEVVVTMGKNTLLDIKRDLDQYVGQKIMLKANGGRRKTIERAGILEETYPSVFIVKLDEEQHSFKRVSYSYADILTETVELTVCQDENDHIRITYVKQ